MNDESGFLQAILAEPANNDLRLSFADWLEEPGDPTSLTKAEFLRLTVSEPDLPVPGPKQRGPGTRREKLAAADRVKEGQARQRRRQELAAELDTDWLAVTSRLPVENCPNQRVERGRRYSISFRAPDKSPPFQLLCDRRWHDLRTTEAAAVRDCEGCQQPVHYCDTIGEARRHAEAGHCIAIDLGIIRRERDLEPRMLVLGRPSATFLREEEDRMKPDPVSAAREERRRQEALRKNAG